MKLKFLVILFTPLFLNSCDQQDKALLAEYESQNEEIADLESQINRINKKITENYIKDPSKKVEELQSQLEKIEAEKETLLDEIAAAKKETQNEAEKLRQYQSKYRIKSE